MSVAERFARTRDWARRVPPQGWALGLFVALALFQFWPAFAPQTTMAFPGDGWGTIGWIFDLHDNLVRRGPSILLGDKYLSDAIGVGVNHVGSPTNTFWKAWYALLGYVFAPDNVYDLTGLLGLLLVNWAGLRLARELRAPWWLAIFFALLLGLSLHYRARLNGHLTFATFFMPLVVVRYALRAGKRPNRRAMLALGVAAWLNFVINEYYGYFGVFAAGALLLGSLACFPSEERRRPLRVLRAMAWGAVVFAVLMAVTYPSLLAPRVTAWVGGQAPVEEVAAHPRSDFYLYSGGLTPMFRPNMRVLYPLAPDSYVRAGQPPEYTMVVGYMVGLVSTLTFLFLLGRWIWLRWGRRREADHTDLLTFVALFVMIRVCYSFALSPDNALSLVPITMKFAPMFRVGLRALIYAMIGALGLFVVSALAWRKLAPAGEWSEHVHAGRLGTALLQALNAGILALVMVTVWFEVLGHFGPPIPSLGTKVLPQPPVYRVLAAQPPGVLLDLPFHAPGEYPPEADYDYLLARRVHHKPIVGGAHFLGNAFTLNLAARRTDLNRNILAHLDTLGRSGVRYLVVHATDRFDFSALARAPQLERLFQDPDATLYRIRGEQPFVADALRRTLFAVHWTPEALAVPATAAVQAGIEPAAAGRPAVLRLRVDSAAAAPLLELGEPIEIPAGRYIAEFHLAGQPGDTSVAAPLEVALRTDEQQLAHKVVLAAMLPRDVPGELSVPFVCRARCRVKPALRMRTAGEFRVGTVTVWLPQLER